MPKGPRKFHFAFERSGLTRFGGLSLFQGFCHAFAIRHFLQLAVRWPDYDYREYHPADLFLAHVYCIVAGIGRIENTQCLIPNGLIPPLLGLAEFPHRDTLRSFLLRFGARELRSLQAAHDKLRAALFPRLGLRYSATRRCGYHDADHLWISGRGGAGLYSQAASRATLVRSDSCQRRAQWPQPGNGTEIGECPPFGRSRGLPPPQKQGENVQKQIQDLFQGSRDRFRREFGGVGRAPDWRPRVSQVALWLVAIAPTALLIYWSARPVMRLREEPPAAFLDPGPGLSSKQAASVARLGRAYWDWALQHVQRKYPFGTRLPDAPPPGFDADARDLPKGLESDVIKLRYWRKLRDVWGQPQVWETSYLWNQ